jgi:hypothetical protein
MAGIPGRGAREAYAEANTAEMWEQKLRGLQAQKKYDDLKHGRTGSPSEGLGGGGGGDRWVDAEKALGLRQIFCL